MESFFPTPVFHSLNEVECKTEKNDFLTETKKQQDINDEEGLKKNENENLANVLQEFLIPQQPFEKNDDAEEGYEGAYERAEINKISRSISEYKENEHKFSFAENEAIKIKGSQNRI